MSIDRCRFLDYKRNGIAIHNEMVGNAAFLHTLLQLLSVSYGSIFDGQPSGDTMSVIG